MFFRKTGDSGRIAVAVVQMLFLACVVVVLLLLILRVGGLREWAGGAFFGIFLFGGAVWWAASGEARDASSPTQSERARVWGDLGRSLLVAGLMAFAVWAVAELRRPIEARHNLQLTLGVQGAMPGVDLHGENLHGFDLARKNLRGANLRDANLSKATLVDTDLAEADLTGADLTGAILEKTNFTDARLNEAELDWTDADSVVLRRAEMAGADLTGARLSGARMQGACLTGATLAKAYLPDAQLDRADLTGANLRRTRFWYDLRPADLRSVGLSGALYGNSARWPPRIRQSWEDLVHPDGNRAPRSPRPVRDRTETGTVLFVPDGDTLALDPDRGGRVRLRVRLIGIDAPEIDELPGLEARHLLRHLLPKGTQVLYEYDKRREDKFGRRLMYVYARNGWLVNQLMVERGRAVIALDPPGNARSNDLYARRLQSGEAWARGHALGMWRSCPFRSR
jgi:uncharacterized protein YjbI with pentapeptide repeats/endonuclease YncB( thermonuclease family)